MTPAGRRTATVVEPANVAAVRTAGGAVVRQLADTSTSAGAGLVRRLVEIRAGTSVADAVPSAQLWYVLGGHGSLIVPDQAGQHARQLSPDMGVLLPGGTRHRLAATGPADLRLDNVTLPGATRLATGDGMPVVRGLAECPVETTGDRRFRVLFGPGRDCRLATQFVGEIPPGRAPEHSHPYDEVVLILDGDGVAHAGGEQHALAPGTCIHLPPGVPHCLENTGPAVMRVLGVFHPADSPATKLGAAQPSAE